MRALVICLSVLVGGCITTGPNGTKPKTVTETGYITCKPDADACPNAVKCVDAAGAETCIDFVDACNEATCGCLAAITCGEEACTDDPNGAGITCGAASDPKDPADPNEPGDPNDPLDPSDPGDPNDPTDPGDPNDPTDPGDPNDPADPGDPNDPTDPTACDPAQTYLTPGCGPNEVEWAPGCYDSAALDACSSDADCGEGLQCADITYDPCWNSDCEACGASATLCLPTTDPSVPDSDGDGSPDDEDCAPNDSAIHPDAAEQCNGIDDNCDGQIDDGCGDPNDPCGADQTYLTQGCGPNEVEWTPGCYANAALGCGADADCGEGLQCVDITYDPCWNAPCAACGAGETLCVPSTQPDPNVSDWYVAGGGSSFGECFGACKRDVTLDAAGNAHLLITGWAEDTYADNTGQLTGGGMAEAYELAVMLEAVDLEKVYGCPDCADGGASRADLMRGGVASSHTYEYGDPPAELKAVDVFVKDVIDALSSCIASTRVQPAEDCVPYSP